MKSCCSGEAAAEKKELKKRMAENNLRRDEELLRQRRNDALALRASIAREREREARHSAGRPPQMDIGEIRRASISGEDVGAPRPQRIIKRPSPLVGLNNEAPVAAPVAVLPPPPQQQPPIDRLEQTRVLDMMRKDAVQREVAAARAPNQSRPSPSPTRPEPPQMAKSKPRVRIWQAATGVVVSAAFILLVLDAPLSLEALLSRSETPSYEIAATSVTPPIPLPPTPPTNKGWSITNAFYFVAEDFWRAVNQLQSKRGASGRGHVRHHGATNAKSTLAPTEPAIEEFLASKPADFATTDSSRSAEEREAHDPPGLSNSPPLAPIATLAVPVSMPSEPELLSVEDGDDPPPTIEPPMKTQPSLSPTPPLQARAWFAAVTASVVLLLGLLLFCVVNVDKKKSNTHGKVGTAKPEVKKARTSLVTEGATADSRTAKPNSTISQLISTRRGKLEGLPLAATTEVYSLPVNEVVTTDGMRRAPKRGTTTPNYGVEEIEKSSSQDEASHPVERDSPRDNRIPDEDSLDPLESTAPDVNALGIGNDLEHSARHDVVVNPPPVAGDSPLVAELVSGDAQAKAGILPVVASSPDVVGQQEPASEKATHSPPLEASPSPAPDAPFLDDFITAERIPPPNETIPPVDVATRASSTQQTDVEPQSVSRSHTVPLVAAAYESALIERMDKLATELETIEDQAMRRRLEADLIHTTQYTDLTTELKGAVSALSSQLATLKEERTARRSGQLRRPASAAVIQRPMRFRNPVVPPKPKAEEEPEAGSNDPPTDAHVVRSGTEAERLLKEILIRENKEKHDLLAKVEIEQLKTALSSDSSSLGNAGSSAERALSDNPLTRPEETTKPDPTLASTSDGGIWF